MSTPRLHAKDHSTREVASLRRTMDLSIVETHGFLLPYLPKRERILRYSRSICLLEWQDYRDQLSIEPFGTPAEFPVDLESRG